MHHSGTNPLSRLHSRWLLLLSSRLLLSLLLWQTLSL
jgi:hypothetical protein